MDGKARVLLLIPRASYRATDFLEAAAKLNVEVIVGSNHEQVLSDFNPGRNLQVDFDNESSAIDLVVAHCKTYPVLAVIGTDDESVCLAASASRRLMLPHNSIDAVLAARDKYLFRKKLQHAAVNSPAFRLESTRQAATGAAARQSYPCVLKPRCLSASRGVIRANTIREFVGAFETVKAILDGCRGLDEAFRNSVLVEDYIDGDEVALEGLFVAGRLQVLALFDKPDPLTGPYFEETIYVTPSRFAADVQDTIVDEVTRVALTLGLITGPIHAEARVNSSGVFVLEIAPRTIGGLCARALRFSGGNSLEELVLTHAMGRPVSHLNREAPASGVLMIPVPRSGYLTSVDGIDAARQIPEVTDLRITAVMGAFIAAPPHTDQYLGFIFARGTSPQRVEDSLREAHACLSLQWHESCVSRRKHDRASLRNLT